MLAAVLMSMIVLRFPTWSRYLERIEAEMRRIVIRRVNSSHSSAGSASRGGMVE